MGIKIKFSFPSSKIIGENKKFRFITKFKSKKNTLLVCFISYSVKRAEIL